MSLPIVAVGLLYGNGYFQQSLTRDAWQVETYPLLDPDGLPLAVLREDDSTPVVISLDLPGGRKLHAHAWVAAVGRVPLLLLDSNVPDNDEAARKVTDRLYGGGGEHRLQQELLLGVGGVRALRAWSRLTGAPEPEVYHTHGGDGAAVLALQINELCPDDDGFQIDEHGQTDDWIELRNGTATALDLAGFTLGDGGRPHALPQRRLAPGETALLWADGSPEQGPSHLGFKLAAKGGRVELRDRAGALIDTVAYPALETNVAFGRFPDGATSLAACRYASPGRANGLRCGPPPPTELPVEAQYAPFSFPPGWGLPTGPLVVTELALRPTGFVEVANLGSAPLALAEFSLRLAATQPGQAWPGAAEGTELAWPRGGAIAAGERLTVPVSAPAAHGPVRRDPHRRDRGGGHPLPARRRRDRAAAAGLHRGAGGRGAGPGLRRRRRGRGLPAVRDRHPRRRQQPLPPAAHPRRSATASASCSPPTTCGRSATAAPASTAWRPRWWWTWRRATPCTSCRPAPGPCTTPSSASGSTASRTWTAATRSRPPSSTPPGASSPTASITRRWAGASCWGRWSATAAAGC